METESEIKELTCNLLGRDRDQTGGYSAILQIWVTTPQEMLDHLVIDSGCGHFDTSMFLRIDSTARMT
ncbi:hypothetical protein M0L46_005871, partial [Pseudomonas aeruginosa]